MSKIKGICIFIPMFIMIVLALSGTRPLKSSKSVNIGTKFIFIVHLIEKDSEIIFRYLGGQIPGKTLKSEIEPISFDGDPFHGYSIK